ncbi:Stealth CR1 domain-containing protein [Brachybacterium alimentarium]|uniref:stealth family protein n=1 Tax=Brachybacterium alimentarium TaxID=47845 RepID=UPI0015F110E3|nr:stealth family protein [Brachybacterium alimentarium]
MVHDSEDRSPRIAIRSVDVLRAAEVIAEQCDGALIGVDERFEHASKVRFSSGQLPGGDICGARRAYVLSPAISVSGGDIVKRYGFECSVTIEVWRAFDGFGNWASGMWNPVANVLPDSAFSADAPKFDKRAELSGGFDVPHLMEVAFPVDAVYTWVDGTDPQWLERKRHALERNSGDPMPEAAAEDLRFVGHDELRYSLRSLENYAPWVRHVYIVTDGQRPDWLRDDTDWVSVVDHRDIAPEGTELPTFNSQAIEANLHRIDGLSEHFLYFNDDMFLSSPVSPDLFFHANGLASVFLSRALVAPGDPVEGEPAPDAAGKNARDLVWQVCGRRLSRKLFHAPYALNTTISQEIEDRWPETVQRTRDSQFRRLEDITLAGGLHLNYAYAVGRAVTRKIRYRYVGIGEESAASELERLIKDKDSLQTFCLNDAVQDIAPDVADRQVREFLERRFPDMGSFERLPE